MSTGANCLGLLIVELKLAIIAFRSYLPRMISMPRPVYVVGSVKSSSRPRVTSLVVVGWMYS